MPAVALALTPVRERGKRSGTMAESDDYIPVAVVGDIPEGGMKCVAIERARVLLAHVEGRFYAIGDLCGHRNAPLSRGRLTGHIVECPLHFAQFDVRDGSLVDGPVSAPVRQYDVCVEGDTILVRR